MKGPQLAPVVLLLLGQSVSAAPTTTGLNRAEFRTAGLNLIGGNFPEHVRDGIEDATRQWNDLDCNALGQDFAQFRLLGPFNEEIDVLYLEVVSDRVEGQNTVCAETFPSPTGTSTEIRLYSQTRHSNGQLYPCYTNRHITNDSFAHELGHFLGLGHPNCPAGDVMSRRTGTFGAGGQVTWSTNRRVLNRECRLADVVSQLPGETNDDGECDFDSIDPCFPDPDDFPSPIIIDFDRNGLSLTGLKDPVLFDIDADGALERIGWTALDSGDGFLVRDRNFNGLVDDGSELFGNATRLGNGRLARHGFEALQELDQHGFAGNENGVLDVGDSAFFELAIWFDTNHDGVSQEGELKTLLETRVDNLNVDPQIRLEDFHDEYGNWYGYVSQAQIFAEDLTTVLVDSIDVFFVSGPTIEQIP